MHRPGFVAFVLVATWTVVQQPHALAQTKPLPPPPKPYGAVALALPRPPADASFETFRKELGAIVKRMQGNPVVGFTVPAAQ